MADRPRRRSGGPQLHRGHPPQRGGPPPPQPDGPPPPPPPEGSDEPGLLTDVREALDAPHPLGLLALTSSLVAAVDPRRVDPFQPAQDEDPAAPTLQDLVGSFVEIEIPETTALLTVLAGMIDDEVLTRRMSREVARRDHQLPAWLTGLAPLAVHRALELSHVLGDGDNVMLDVTTAAGDELTALVYIDHNLGTLVKDAFVAEGRLEEMAAQFRTVADDPDLHWRELDLADARTRIEDAIELAAMTYPPLETESWPASRPLIEWVARQLPRGGTGYQRPEWSEADRRALLERFLASPAGRAHDQRDDRDLLESLLWFGCDYGPGDPLRWSPVAVELLLTDWLPRKVIADAEFLGRAPDLLRSFVRFAHAERGIRESLTAETLAAVDTHEPEYLETIRSPRPQEPAALLAAMGIDEDVDPWAEVIAESHERMRQLLRDTVGGEEVLEALDTAPLPDEPFDWDAVPDDVGERVGEVLALTDGCCGELLDTECRTACRRLLADVAAADPAIFRRRGRPDTAAAAITWVVARANHAFDSYHGGLTAKALLAWFGLSGSVSQRARTLLRAVGVDLHTSADLRLGTTRYLVSVERGRIIDSRDRWAAAQG